LRVNAGYMLCKGNIKDAEKIYLKSIEHCLKYKRKFEAAKSYYEYGLLLKLLRRIDEAKSSFESAYDIFDKIGADSYKIKTADYLGISYQENYLTRGVPKEIRNYQRMYSVISLIRNISSILDLNVLLDKILMTAIEISGAQNGYLMLRNEKTGNIETFVKKVTSGSASDVSNQIVQMVNDRGEAVVTNIADGANSVQSSMLINKTKSVLCLPIKSNDEIVGICYLENKLSSAVFEQEDVEILNTVLAQAAISIENAKLYNVATTDGLTGLISHMHFKYSLEKEIERCKRYKKVFSLIMFDVDHFKTINDTYGHQAGDLVLVTVANVLRDTFRSSDIIGRYGGDEIVVILPEIDESATLIAAKRLMDAIRNIKIQYEDKTISLTISAGIVIYNKHLLNCADMIKAVDNAMYISKKNGRNRFSIHDGTTLS
jgi:diguanylate cyclase (GGDEF)-like protein